MPMLNEDHAKALAELIINNDFKPTNDGQKELLRKFKKHPSFKGYEITVNRFVAQNASLGSVVMKAAYEHSLYYESNPYASDGKNEFANFIVPHKKLFSDMEELKKKILEIYDKDARRYRFIDIPNLKGEKTVKEMSDEYYETHDPISYRGESFIENIPGIIGFSIPILMLISLIWFFGSFISNSGESSGLTDTEIKNICKEEVISSGIEYRCETRSCISREVEKELASCISRYK
tara:strand:- start:2522 stop:3226 length:705 start_codon:yes stop_codon:yes gene_type:complete